MGIVVLIVVVGGVDGYCEDYNFCCVMLVWWFVGVGEVG